MAIVWPYASFYYINPTNEKPIDFIFAESISQKYSDLVIFQIIQITCCYFLGLFLFENPPQFSSDMSNYLNMDRENIINKAMILSVNGSKLKSKR